MYGGKLVFAQLMEFALWYAFRRLVEKYRGDFHVLSFTCLDQFLCLAFAQLTYRENLRDIEACLRAQDSKLYHLGIRGSISRSALSDANEGRDWRIHFEFAQALIRIARRLYASEALAVDLNETVCARSIPRRSTCVWPCFSGHRFATPRLRSSCTRCSICVAPFRRSFTSATASSTTSTCSTC